ncbi:hypothetical protein [Kutzneria buriramensis]|uniref:Uncharacterized protein n=1 Tax=Kutzneria buriramensis TaxID=1045776 RepID=A0A3E0GY31_9PSEU|nr:hypothetical protein [Kutzneria buriramensis]REH31020.1 hypothetical protein BCF44_12243 [Kutzneria buriramensis]
MVAKFAAEIRTNHGQPGATCTYGVVINEVVYGDEIMGDEVPCGQPANFMVNPELLAPDQPPRYSCPRHAKHYGNDLTPIAH